MAEGATDGDPPPLPEGHPDRILSYMLDFPDALAWERVSHAHRKRDRAGIGAAIFAGIGLLNMAQGQLTDWSVLHSLPMAFLVLALPLGLVLLLFRQDRVKRARVLRGGPVWVRLEITGDRLVERHEGREAPVATFGARSLREVVLRRAHVFLSTGAEVIIVPERAFADAAEMTAFARDWSARMED